jgi:cytochrome c5
MRVPASSVRRGIGSVLVAALLAAALIGDVALAQAQRGRPPNPPQDTSGMQRSHGMMGCGPMAESMMIGGQMPPGADPASLPASGSPGAKLVGHYCTQCHGLPMPDLHSADGWTSVIQRMDMRMQWMAHYGNAPIQAPTSQEFQSIVDYMREHAAR